MPEAALSVSNNNAARSRIAALCAPMTSDDFISLIIRNGFTVAGYLRANPDLAAHAKTPADLLAHFCEHGIPEGRHFWLKVDPPDILERLRSLSEAPLADTAYRMALMAVFGGAWWNEKLLHDPKVVAGTPRESADQFSDNDIQAMLACRAFGALPYFVFGDSHARLYQHIRLLPEKGWLLPVSITCSGGSARGLCNPVSTLHYGARLTAFFDRVRPFVTSGTKCFFKFGQVDLDYLFPLKWSQEGYRDFDPARLKEFTDQTLERYVFFLKNLVPDDLRRNTYICSVSLPALIDQTWCESYVSGLVSWLKIEPDKAAELMTSVSAMAMPDLATRTRWHLDFNDRLQKLVEAEGFPFVNDCGLFLNAQGTQVDDAFLQNGGGKDVHIDRGEPTLRLIAPLIYERVSHH